MKRVWVTSMMLLAGAGAVGCGGGATREAEPERTQSTVPDLPTVQRTLVPDLCPARGKLPEAEAQARRRHAELKLQALEAAYVDDPDATTRTSYREPQTGEKVKEHTPIRRLVEIELQTVAQVAQTGDAAAAACARRVERRLRSLTDAR
jgi:hypothetical protein